MINTAEIIASICEKIKFVAGDEFLLEEQFEKQLAEIKSNFLEAKNTYLASNKERILTPFLTDFSFKASETVEKANKLFNQYYNRTNSFLENSLWGEWDDRYPLYFRDLLISDDLVREKFLVEYKNILVTIKNAKKALDTEDLKKANNFYINIESHGIKNSQNSISSLSDVKEYGLYQQNSFSIIIFLISNERIIKLSAGNHSISSEEHIIVKDLKKVALTDSTVEFHYHGLHQPDCLEMDTYDDAVKLRILISELRENKRNTR